MSIDRTKAAALFREEVAPVVAERAIQSSTALTDFPRVDMGQKVDKLPVLAALPVGGFLSADQAVKTESDVTWADKTLTAEEIAVVVPISQTVIDDSSIDVVAKVTELVGQEFGRVIDAAVFFGTGKPASWPDGLAPLAVTATQTVVAVDDPAVDFNALFGLVEAVDYDVTNVYGARTIKAALRGQLGAPGGSHVYLPGDGKVDFGSVYGAPLGFPLGWDATQADAIAVDKSGIVLGVRQDVKIDILREATLPVFGSLAMKDSIAVRAVMRVAFQVVDPVSINGGRKYPVASLTPKP